MEFQRFCFQFAFHERLHDKKLSRPKVLFTYKIGEAFDAVFIYIYNNIL